MLWTKEKLEAHYKQQIEQWNEMGILARGKNELLAHFRGEIQSKGDAIKAHCYECMGGYANDGGLENRDCENPPCPLYPHHPYNLNKFKTKTPGNPKALLRRPRISVKET